MNAVLKTDSKENRFKKILDDAGRALEDIGGYQFLDDLPKMADNGKSHIPFPYGSQPENKTGWK